MQLGAVGTKRFVICLSVVRTKERKRKETEKTGSKCEDERVSRLEFHVVVVFIVVVIVLLLWGPRRKV